MTESQRRAMIAFHTKAEAAYRAVGKITDAEAAAKMRRELEAKGATK